jgi:hypothetical protein
MAPGPFPNRPPFYGTGVLPQLTAVARTVPPEPHTGEGVILSAADGALSMRHPDRSRGYHFVE